MQVGVLFPKSHTERYTHKEAEYQNCSADCKTLSHGKIPIGYKIFVQFGLKTAEKSSNLCNWSQITFFFLRSSLLQWLQIQSAISWPILNQILILIYHFEAHETQILNSHDYCCKGQIRSYFTLKRPFSDKFMIWP